MQTEIVRDWQAETRHLIDRAWRLDRRATPLPFERLCDLAALVRRLVDTADVERPEAVARVIQAERGLHQRRRERQRALARAQVMPAHVAVAIVLMTRAREARRP